MPFGPSSSHWPSYTRPAVGGGPMGLFAAIPAVIAYNRFSAGAESLIARYDVFVEEFASIVNRQAVSGHRRG